MRRRRVRALGELGSGVGSAVGLAALLAALFFDFGVESSEEGALAFRVLSTIKFGVHLGEIEMHFGAAGIELRGGLKLLHSIF